MKDFIPVICFGAKTEGKGVLRKMKRMWYHEVTESQQGHTVEWVLRQVLRLGKRQIRRIKFREDGICVNGRRQRVTCRLCAGDLLRICLEEEQDSAQLEEQEGFLKILYEDADLIAVEKRSGQICHPSGGHYADSLANQLAGYFRRTRGGAVIRIVGRLDVDTSGIVLAAKNQIAASRLAEQREQGILQKEYLALVHGAFGQQEGVIEGKIGILREHPRKMCVCENGKEARTHYQVLQCAGGYSLVRCVLETGRTHQIRVHMCSIGHPLVNDRIYGAGDADPFGSLLESRISPADGRHRQLGLHAERIRLRQPFTGEEIEIFSVCEFADWLTML